MHELREIRVLFPREGSEISVAYAHDDPGLPNPGAKTRPTTAARMARKGLERALEGLDAAEVVWGGFSTDTRLSTDVVVLDRKKRAA